MTMSSEIRMQVFLGSLQRAGQRVAAALAGLSFGQFLLVCVIALIAAGILEGIFEPATGHRVKVTRSTAKGKNDPQGADAKAKDAPTNEIRIDKEGVTIERKPGSANEPGADAQSKDKDVPSAEIRIGKDGITIQGKARQRIDAGTTAEPILDVEDFEDVPKSKRSRISIPLITVLALLALFVIRMFARGQQRVQKLADAAQAVAERETLQRQVVEARLQLLQAQVEPHFLFNTLAAVEHLIETDPARAATMQHHLIDYLRAALPRMRQQSATLGQETELCANFLKIMQMRMEERLQLSVAVPVGLASAVFPPMMLQTLVENAVQHGLEPKPDGGRIDLTAEIRDGQLCVTVADTGMGFSSTPRAGVGLANIRERLQQLYDSHAGLTIESNQPCGTRATVSIPYAVA